MKRYRLFHRGLREFRDLDAESAQEACQAVGWPIGDTWVREMSRGQYSIGWRNITKREVKHG